MISSKRTTVNRISVKKIIAASRSDYLAGKTRDARELLAEVTAKPKKSTRALKH
jgi:hypothetical protein